MDLMMTGRLLSAEEAERIGLVQRVAAAEAFDSGIRPRQGRQEKYRRGCE